MAKARPLVGGFLERISVTAFEKYHREITDLVRSQHGVYALYKNDRLYYVGLAVNLRRRIKQHLRDKHAGRWNRFSLYLVRKVDHIKEIESLLLRIADPAGNKQGGRLRKATNLDRQLRRKMQKRQKEELDEIFAKDAGPQRAVSKAARSRKVKRKKAGRGDRVDRPLKGLVGAGKRIYATYKGKEFKAIVYRNGRIKFNGQLYDSPSAAGKSVQKRETNGWSFWRVRKDGGW
ncbi:MAG: DUF2924 domain-containing protein [Planctomycetes bacterium]|nr:DUF2924 domain-containing protein [Planctomycetota bacterium]